MQRSGPKSSMVSRIQGRTWATLQWRPKRHSIPKILTATLSQAATAARPRFQFSIAAWGFGSSPGGTNDCH